MQGSGFEVDCGGAADCDWAKEGKGERGKETGKQEGLHVELDDSDDGVFQPGTIYARRLAQTSDFFISVGALRVMLTAQ